MEHKGGDEPLPATNSKAFTFSTRGKEEMNNSSNVNERFLGDCRSVVQ